MVTAVRRRDRGVRTPHPRAVCRRPSPPARALGGSLRADRPWRAIRGGKWMAASGSPVRRGVPAVVGRSVRPFQVMLHSGPPAGGLGPGGCRSRIFYIRGPVSPGLPPGEAFWLILPVVICLSQRLSHACLSISNLYCETANGSLNQLSFI